MTDGRDSAGWGERAVNKVARLAIANLVDAEQVDVWVKTTLPQAMRGEVDGISIYLQAFLARENLRVETFRLQIGAVAVITKLAVKGTIQLIQPATGTLTLGLKLRQLNNFLNAVFVNGYEQYLSSAQDSIQNYKIYQIKTAFVSEQQFQIQLDWAVQGTESIQTSIVLTAPTIASDGQSVQLVVQSLAGQEVPHELLPAILSPIEEILSLQDLKQRGTSFQIQQLEFEADALTVHAAATVDQFPSR